MTLCSLGNKGFDGHMSSAVPALSHAAPRPLGMALIVNESITATEVELRLGNYADAFHPISLPAAAHGPRDPAGLSMIDVLPEGLDRQYIASPEERCSRTSLTWRSFGSEALLTFVNGAMLSRLWQEPGVRRPVEG